MVTLPRCAVAVVAAVVVALFITVGKPMMMVVLTALALGGGMTVVAGIRPGDEAGDARLTFCGCRSGLLE